MKKIYTSTLFLIVVLFSASAQGKKITVYTDDFSGNHEELGVGRYDNIYLAQSGISFVGSFKVPAGMKVTLYSEDRFSGKSIVLTEDAHTRYLQGKGFAQIGLRVSIIVEEAPMTTSSEAVPVVTIYKDNFSGASKNLAPGYYQFYELGDIDNDQLSSVKIPKGMKVILYEHKDFGGKSLVLTEDASATFLIANKFNDYTSSIKVEAAPAPPPPAIVKEVVVVHDTIRVEPTPKPIETNQPTDSTVTVFQDDFGGISKNLVVGRYDIERLAFNDELSSLKIPKDFRVTLYEHDGFEGRSLVLTGDTHTAFLNDNDFNNKTSSIVVEKLPKVTIYQGDFSGESKSFGPGRYMRDSLGIGGDRLSSVKIPKGMRVTLYDHFNFQGSSIELTHDTRMAFLTKHDFNNITSSMVVEQLENVLPTVTVYQDDFSGASKKLTSGRYDYQYFGIGNNTLSSIQIPRGFRVTLYEYAGFEGRTLELRSDAHTEFLQSKSFNDITSSVVVEQIPESDLMVTIFKDSYGGPSVRFGLGRYRTIAFGDNQLSSVRVPNGMRAILFDDENFTTPLVTLEANADFSGIKSLNDRTSSIIVEDVLETTSTPTTPPLPVIEPVVIPVVIQEPSTVPTVVYSYEPDCAMTSDQYSNAFKAIESKPFSDEKMATARLATKDKCMSLEQIRGIAKLFSFEEQTLEFVKYAYDLSTEKTEYYLLDDVFRFMSSKDAFSKFLSSK